MDTPWLLVHSSGFPSIQWRKLAPLLHTKALTPNLPGYPGTPWDPTRPVLRADAEYIVAQAQVQGTVHLVGHSYGGLVALHAAYLAPELFRSITLIEPIVYGVMPAGTPVDRDLKRAMEAVGWAVESGNHEHALRAFFDFWGGEGAFDRMPTPVRQGILGMSAKLVREIQATGTENTPPSQWATVKPLTIIVSEGRKPFIHTMAESLCNAVPGSQLVIVPGEHMCPVTHPEDLAAALNAIRKNYLSN